MTNYTSLYHVWVQGGSNVYGGVHCIAIFTCACQGVCAVRTFSIEPVFTHLCEVRAIVRTLIQSSVELC
jgi:hypothetical protein